MKGTLISIDFDNGEKAKLKQGVTDCYTPSNAVNGSNGSFICAGPAQLWAYIELENGEMIEQNITELVKYEKGWERLTDKRINETSEKLVGTIVDVQFIDDEVRRIDGLREAIEEM